MDYNLYRFESRGYLTTVAATPDIFTRALDEGRQDLDSDCHRHLFVGDYAPYQMPVVFRQFDGKIFRDFLETRYPPINLVSDRVTKLLKDNSVTGWGSYPITLYDKKGGIIKGYSGFSVIGYGGKMTRFWDYGFNIDTEEHYLAERGLYDISQWDGSDIFRVEWGFVFVTERVMRLMRASKVTAVRFDKLSDDTDIIGTPHFF